MLFLIVLLMKILRLIKEGRVFRLLIRVMIRMVMLIATRISLLNATNGDSLYSIRHRGLFFIYGARILLRK